MIYYLQRCASFLKISGSTRVPFDTESEAVSSGYRMARNC
jgi:hypothetical protein